MSTLKSESELTRLLCKMYDGLSYPLIGGKWSPNGWPDRLFQVNNKLVLVEFKLKGEWLDPHQEILCRRLGAYVCELDPAYRFTRKRDCPAELPHLISDALQNEVGRFWTPVEFAEIIGV